jgi:hypothetical protein
MLGTQLTEILLGVNVRLPHEVASLVMGKSGRVLKTTVASGSDPKRTLRPWSLVTYDS